MFSVSIVVYTNVYYYTQRRFTAKFLVIRHRLNTPTIGIHYIVLRDRNVEYGKFLFYCLRLEIPSLRVHKPYNTIQWRSTTWFWEYNIRFDPKCNNIRKLRRSNLCFLLKYIYLIPTVLSINFIKNDF